MNVSFLIHNEIFMCPGENPLAFLRNQPQFLHMRQAIQQNPNLLSALLQQLGQENPQLLQVPWGWGGWLEMLPRISNHGTGGFFRWGWGWLERLLSQSRCVSPPANQSASGAVHPDVERARRRGRRDGGSRRRGLVRQLHPGYTSGEGSHRKGV